MKAFGMTLPHDVSAVLKPSGMGLTLTDKSHASTSSLPLLPPTQIKKGPVPLHTSKTTSNISQAVVEIEVFNALRTRCDVALQNIYYLSQNNPSKRIPILKKMNASSLEVIDMTFPPQGPTNVVGHCHYKKWS